MAFGDILDDVNDSVTDTKDTLANKTVPLSSSDPDYTVVSDDLATAKTKAIDAQNEPALSGLTGAPILVPNPPGPGDIPWVDQLKTWADEAIELWTNKGPGNFKQELANRMKSIEVHEADARAEALQ